MQGPQSSTVLFTRVIKLVELVVRRHLPFSPLRWNNLEEETSLSSAPCKVRGGASVRDVTHVASNHVDVYIPLPGENLRCVSTPQEQHDTANFHAVGVKMRRLQARLMLFGPAMPSNLSFDAIFLAGTMLAKCGRFLYVT